MAGSGLVKGLPPADPRQLNTTALHARVGKQQSAQRARTEMRKALQFTTQRGHRNNGACINPWLTVTEQVYLADNRQTPRLHIQYPRLINPGRSPGL